MRTLRDYVYEYPLLVLGSTWQKIIPSPASSVAIKLIARLLVPRHLKTINSTCGEGCKIDTVYILYVIFPVN